MMSALFVFLAFIACVQAGIPSPKSISASLRDTEVNGLEGLNIRAVFPFKFDEYIVGFKHSFDSLNRAPDSLFVQRSFETGELGTATVDAEFDTRQNVGSVGLKWLSQKLGLQIRASADTRDHLTGADISTVHNIQGTKVGLSAAYDFLAKRVSTKTTVATEDTEVALTFDTANRNPQLSVGHKIDENNIITPSISLLHGDVKYGWTRRWQGGSLESTLHPGDKLSFDWRDEGRDGTWTTRAEIPMDDASKSKITVSRDWKY